MGKAVEHESDAGQDDHGLEDLRQFLVVLGQVPVAAKPAERSFNHPSPRQHNEAGPGDPAHDDQRQAKQKAGEPDRQTVVDAVGEHRLELAV